MPVEFKTSSLATLIVRASSYSVLPFCQIHWLLRTYYLIVIFALPRCSLTVLVAITLAIPT